MKFKIAFTCALLIATSVMAQTPPAQTPPPKPAAPPAAAPAPPPAPAPAPAAKEVAPGEVVLTIGTETLTRAQYESLLRNVPGQFAQTASQMGKKQFATQYAMMLGLARTAEKEKMDQGVAFEFMKMQLLAQMAFQAISQRNQAVTEEQVKAYYQAHEGEFQQATVRGIYVSFNPPKGKDGKEPKGRSEDETKTIALALRDKIIQGADFATVAKESSEEPETAAKGGDLGTVRRGQLPPNIEKAVFSLKSKEVSQPVAEATGFYIFKMEDLRSTTLEEATPQIRQKLVEAATVSTLEKIKDGFPVIYNDSYFVEPPPNPLAPGTAPRPKP